MKKSLLLLLFAPVFAVAQNTTVNATVVDTDGTAWFSGTWQIDFRPNNSQPGEGSYRLINGQPLSGAVTHQKGTLDASGHAAITVYDSTLIVPTGSGWTLVICPNASASCGTYQFTTAGSSMDISSRLTSVMPVPRFEATGSKAFGYIDLEAMVRVSTGGCYWNVTSNKQRCWTGSAFVDAAGATGGVPGGNNNEVQINNGGSTFGAASGVSYDGSGGLVGKQFNAFRYAGPWQTTPTSNNGIANAAASGQTVIAEPSYATTELIGITGKPPSLVPSQSSLLDFRAAQTNFYYHNPIDTITNSNTALTVNYYNDTIQTSTYNQLGKPDAFGSSITALAPGADYGSAAVGPQNWTSGHAAGFGQIAATPGIFNMTGGVSVHSGIGDTANYYYNANYGGAIAGSDEGNKGMAVQALEIQNTFTGNVTTGGSGATQVKVKCITDCAVKADFINGTGPGDGRFLIDLSNVIDSGNIVSRTAPADPAPGEFVIDHSITPSTAYSTLNGDCNGGQYSYPIPLGTGTNTVNCNVNAVSGSTGVFSTGLVCFSGTFHEQGVITQVVGSQLTMKLRHAHISGSWIMQGGPCGQYIDLTVNDVKSGAGGNLTLHYPLELIGATDGTHLKYNTFYAGTNQDISMGNALLGSTFNYPTTFIGNYGGSVYLGCGSGCTSQAPLFNNGTIQIYGVTPAAYNGACTNTHFYSPGNYFICTQASSVGAGSATVQGHITAGTSQFGSSAYTTYAGAETLDILDRTMSPPQMTNGGAGDGTGGTITFTLEPNNAAWSTSGTGDLVEQSHHYAMMMSNFFGNMIDLNPYAMIPKPFNIGIGGAGICCGSGTDNLAAMFYRPAAISVFAGTPANTIKNHGGFKNPIGGIVLTGAGCGNTGTANICSYSFGLGLAQAPEPTGASALLVGCPASGCTDPDFYYNIFAVRGGSGCCGAAYGLQYRPNTAEFSTMGNWQWNSDFGAQTFRDNISFVPLQAPTVAAPVVSTSGGILNAARTYYYKVYAYNNSGTSVLSNEVIVNAASGMSGTNNSATISWNRVPGAAGYFLCRSDDTNGGSGAELRNSNADNGIGASSVYFVDPGNQTWSGSCSGYAGTAMGTVYWVIGSNPYYAYFKPPTTLSANAVYTLPAASTTLVGTVASGTLTLNPGAIASGACATNATATATGTLATDTFSYAFNAAPDATWGEIIMHPYVAANLIGFQICNPPGGASVTPVSSGVNWKVTR